MSSLEPLADRVLVEPVDDSSATTPGGIIIPEVAREKPQLGRVVAVGQGRIAESGQIIAPRVGVGDTVLYGKYAGTEVTIHNRPMLILRESDLLAISTGEAL